MIIDANFVKKILWWSLMNNIIGSEIIYNDWKFIKAVKIIILLIFNVEKREKNNTNLLHQTNNSNKIYKKTKK